MRARASGSPTCACQRCAHASRCPHCHAPHASWAQRHAEYENGIFFHTGTVSCGVMCKPCWLAGAQQPKIGGEVVPHQDSSFLATSPPTATGLWLALEPATVDNGCLWTLPAPPAARVARHFMRRLGWSFGFKFRFVIGTFRFCGQWLHVHAACAARRAASRGTSYVGWGSRVKYPPPKCKPLTARRARRAALHMQVRLEFKFLNLSKSTPLMRSYTLPGSYGNLHLLQCTQGQRGAGAA